MTEAPDAVAMPESEAASGASRTVVSDEGIRYARLTGILVALVGVIVLVRAGRSGARSRRGGA